ncbi:hypothetical protein [Mesorhizobium sp. L48C026A00]|uniref:hypothetical protein n=1 Tax=Mesorhizobium sp. L48C026A00 TaxID=1287182 RepID=UPI0003CF9EA1|nr:hypothetical protein [Mesorhizobium sp. L48C026A00]ESZ21327.1 hypothetical protein X737_07265 [Mesorhizobium sp. L48C026A00]
MLSVPLTATSTNAAITAPKGYTTKQMGDACEMIVAAELTLAGIPALKVPDNWPGYDVIAQPPNTEPQRISVKSRTHKTGAVYVGYNDYDVFDWLAVVLLLAGEITGRAVYLIPRAVTDELARRDQPTSKTAAERYFRVDQVDDLFQRFRSNFTLDPLGVLATAEAEGS